MNSNENYSPDEVRLLDEFASTYGAGGWAAASSPEQFASICYNAAAGMIAERRKRVPSPNTFTPSPSPTGPNTFMPRPVAKSQPEQGELTEEAVQDWVRLAQSAHHENDDSLNLVYDSEIHRAVALMREGLAAKEQLAKMPPSMLSANMARALLTQDRDESRRILRECMGKISEALGNPAVDWSNDPSIEEAVAKFAAQRIKELEKERDEARAELTKLRTEAAGHDDFVRDACADEANLRARAEKAEAELADARRSLRITASEPLGPWLTAREQQAQAWADKCKQAEAALAEVQPVLDAVVDHFKFHGTKWDRDPFKTLQAYADRRREQAKGAS